MQELGVPFTVDLIVCNPPWIPAKFVPETNPLDNGVYDQDEKFLKSALNYAKIHLDKRGEMLLIYSDLAYKLGLQEQTRIQDLVREYNLRAELIDQTSLPLNRKKTDPMREIKRDSKVQLYKITK